VNGETFTVPLPQAFLLSPKVDQILQSDATTQSFTINTTEAKAEDFALFLTFIHSPTVAKLPVDSGLAYLSFSRLLGNDRLALVVLALLHPVSPVGMTWGSSVGDPAVRAIAFCEADIDYCASLFHLYSVNEMRLVDPALLRQMLESPSLGLRNEDSLLQSHIELGSVDDRVIQFVIVCRLRLCSGN
jgi:hypothetical protein